MSRVQSGYGPIAPWFGSGAIVGPLFSKPLPNESEMFRLEQAACMEERGFLNALWANPEDAATRGMYVDYLLDKGRAKSAELVRGGYTPGYGL